MAMFIAPWSSPQRLALWVFLLFNLLPCLLAGFNVSHLPGFHGPLPFKMEVGYITVNEETGAEFYYFFVESERNPSKDPLIIWFLGGPGCSSINALTLDMGPLRFNVDDFDGQLPNLYANPYAWTKISNLLVVDWSMGTGFSYSKDEADYTSDDVKSTKLIYKFIRKWFSDHPHFFANPFYSGGDSYGGKMALLVAHEIVEDNDRGQQPPINIKGYLVGNAVTGEAVDCNTQHTHAYGLGIISKELFELIENSCVGEDYRWPQNAICAADLKIFNKIFDEINRYSILDPKCSDEPPILKEITVSGRSLEENPAEFLNSASEPQISCITGDLLATYWGNHPLVLEALHVKKGTVKRFHRCDFGVNENHYIRSIPSSVPYHRNLTTRGFRALVYNGDHDLQVPFLGSLLWIKSLNYSVLEQWRSWHAGGQVAGYTMLFENNLTFATVKGGSHVAPGTKPIECFVMFEKWISHRSL